MPRWLGHCVTRGRFQWDFLINQTNCKLLIRYNSSLTPQTLAHRYEKAILRINKNNKCIMLALLFIIVSWKLIFLRWKCLKLRLFFFFFLVYVLRNPKHYNGFVFAIDISFFWWFLLLIVLFCSVCVFLIYVLFFRGCLFLTL